MNCREFAQQVSKVLSPLDDSRTEDFYKYIILTGDSIVSYNDRICIYIRFPTNLECILPAKKFFSILPKSGDAEIKLVDNQLTIKTDNTTAKMNTVDGPDLMASVKSMKLKVKRNWKPLPEDFIKALSLTYPSASMEMNEPAMTCVYVNKLLVAATDEVRISEYTMNDKIDGQILIPAKTVAELIKYDSLTHYSIEDRWIYFSDQRKTRKFCARLVDYEFPDYMPHLDFDAVGTVSLPVKETIEAVRYVAPMAVEDEHGFSWMEVDLRSKEATFTTEDPDVGQAIAKVPIRKAVDVPPFTINPGFLIHIIKNAHKMTIGEDRVRFETNNFTHLIALMQRDSQ